MLLRSLERDQLFRLLPLLIWCGVIFAFSEMPGNGQSGEPPLWYVLERKSAHVFEYAVLAFLSYRFFVSIYPRETWVRIATLVMAFGLAYGALDEFHQSFIFGRGARLTDVAIDGLGIGIGLAIIFALSKRGER